MAEIGGALDFTTGPLEPVHADRLTGRVQSESPAGRGATGEPWQAGTMGEIWPHILYDHGGTGVGRLTFANDFGRGARIRMAKGLVLIIETPFSIT